MNTKLNLHSHKNTETEQSNFLITEMNKESDSSPVNKRFLTQMTMNTTEDKGRLINLINDEQDVPKGAFPKCLGEQMNWIQKFLFCHLKEYCSIVKHSIISKSKRLGEEDLPKQRKFEMVDLGIKYAHEEIKQIKRKLKWYHFLFLLVNKDNQWLIYLSILGFLIDSIAKNFTTVLMQWMLENEEQQNSQVYFYGTALLITSLIGKVAYHHGYMKAEQFSSKSRSLLINVIYGKLTSFNSFTQQEAGIGNILNVMTSDLDSLEKNLQIFLQIIVLPLNFTFAIIIMWIKYDGPIGLIPLGITFILYPLQIVTSKLLGKYINKFQIQTDKKIKIINELLENIRIIKMYAWEDYFINNIHQIRNQECKYQFLYQLGFSFQRSITYGSQLWSSCVFFIILYYLGYEELLNIPLMISTIQLLNLFRSSCVYKFQQAVSAYVQSKIQLNRIAILYNMENINIERPDIIKEEELNQETFAVLQNFGGFWNKSTAVLKNISLNINEGESWSVIGKTGSGKTTFLLSLINEIPHYQGRIQINKNYKIAFVEQEPFIFPDSIRSNIVFGNYFNQDLYIQVLEATKLIEDINSMENYDLTEIGDKGTTLSGGQRARIALARALYSCADVYLLDDPFSALDSRVAQQIYQKVINYFINDFQTRVLGQQPIVILACHQIQYALRCQNIIMIDQGNVLYQGQSRLFQQNIDQLNEEIKIDDYQELGSLKQISLIEKSQKNIIMRKSTLVFNESYNKFKVYYRYFKLWNFSLLLLVVSLNVAFALTYQIYINVVVNFNNQNSDQEQQYLIQQLGYLTLGGILIAFAKYILTFIGCQMASQQIHDDMLQSLVKLPVSYFDATPTGRIINNFSIDQNLADIQTNAVISEVMEIIIGFLISLIAIGFFQKYFLIIAFLLILTNSYFFNYFNQIISQSKDIELMLRGPQVELIKKTLGGITIIKIYNKIEWFKSKFLQQSNKLLMALLNLYYISKLFQVSIESTGLVTQIIGTYLVIYLNRNDFQAFSQQILILSSFNDLITFGLKQFIVFETQLNTYNRMFKFIDEKKEENNSQQNPVQLCGDIEFKNVMMRYNNFSQLTLKGLSFKIEQGMKVGCVGRTGAGKSSIIQALFRMIEIEDIPDSFIKISDKDIRDLSLHSLRSSIGLIPQSPIIFSGTIRQNLDPFNEFSDQQIQEVLKDIELSKIITKADQHINEQMFSTGQKQLICLARLILRNKKIIVLDEATSNLDKETDDFIQNLLNTKLQESTIITIAHRLNSIANYDKVLVLDQGIAIEYDSPYSLLANDINSVQIDKDTEFARLVMSSGQQNSENIFHISKMAYLKKKLPQKMENHTV